jgi:exonuclease SbcC
MKLKSLALRNIRSYRDLEITFPDGILLFEGDIGSGKSTILYAMELAMFGPAEADTKKKKEFYVRAGEKDAWVRLDIEVGGKDYSFHREITRTGSGTCKITVDGAFAEYSPSEMRKKVLEILGFNEPAGARASSVIYRYAVFTPQEEMKQILGMTDDDRLQTLRKAFRIEDYKIARENAETVTRFFRNRSFDLEDMAGERDELRGRLKDRAEAQEKLVSELARDEKDLKTTGETAAQLRSDVQRLDALKERRDRLDGERQRLGDRLEQLNGWLASASEELKGLRQDERQLEELGPRVEEDRKLAKKLEELEEALGERQELELALARMRQQLQNAEKEAARAEEREREALRIKKRMEELAPGIEEISSVEQSLETYQADEAKLREKLERLDCSVDELLEERKGYKDLEKGQKCPKCGQELSAGHLEKVLRDLDKRKEDLGAEKTKLSEKLLAREERVRACRKKLHELEYGRSELRKLEGEEKLLNKEIAECRGIARTVEHTAKEIGRVEDALKDREVEKEATHLRGCRAQWEERRAEMSRLRGRLADLRQRERLLEHRQKEHDEAGEALAKAEAGIKALDGQYDPNVHREKKTDMENALGRIRFLEGAIEGVRRSQDDLAKEMGRVAADIRGKEDELAILARYREGAAWLFEFFGPALESIERHVLSHINYQFDELFKKWFGMLVEGTELEVTVDENFAPIVNQGGYELDIFALSGGEKTAVAFAYRLALNHMVREVVGADTSNLLILDEPTDGFSAEQLSKVREVLRELRAPQLILVSHERELEGFADHIFKVVKENGVSRVEMARG